MDYAKLKTGTEIYYTGDMANVDGFGRISRVFGDKWLPVQYRIVMDDGRVWRSVSPNAFLRIGRRFRVRKEYELERKARIEALMASFA